MSRLGNQADVSVLLAISVEVLSDGEESCVLSTGATVRLKANLIEFSN